MKSEDLRQWLNDIIQGKQQVHQNQQMASSEPLSLSPPPSSTVDLQQWLIEIPQTLNNLLSHDTILPVCIFKLPETRTSEKPDAYIPQRIGLGPIHHFRYDIYSKQEKFKLAIANMKLRHYKLTNDFEKIVKEKLVNLVPIADGCYNVSFDIKKDVLAWVFAIDALVLIDILWNVRNGNGRSNEYIEDVMKLENQIPLMILVKLQNSIDAHFNRTPDIWYVTHPLVSLCQERSPMKFITPKTESDISVDYNYHLLDCMHHLIVNHTLPIVETPVDIENSSYTEYIEEAANVVQTAGEVFPFLNIYLQPILVVLKLPWDKIGALAKKILEETPVALEIDIPSVSLLSRIAKIEFSTTDGGIRDIVFDEEKLTICLPILDLKSDSEVIINNLVAYEESLFKNGTGTKLDFTEYVDFMCGIIDGDKDVKILREKNIIVGDMKNKEILNLFNGIPRSSLKVHGPKSKLQTTIQEVNDHYRNIPKVKVFRSAKKLFLASWKIIIVAFSILSVLLAIYVGVCEVYGCKEHIGLGVRLVIPYASSNDELLDF